MKRKVTLILTAVMLVVVLSMGITLLHTKRTTVVDRVMAEKSLVTTIDKLKLANTMQFLRENGIKNAYQWDQVPLVNVAPGNVQCLDWYFESTDKRKNYLCYYEESEYMEWKDYQNRYLSYSG